jgi:Ca2+-binding EF-hand superfamily protein
MSMLSSKG